MADSPATAPAAGEAPQQTQQPAQPGQPEAAPQVAQPKISAEKLAQLEAMGEEEASEALRLLIKRAPVKVKTKHGEQKIDDFEKLIEHTRRRGTLNEDVRQFMEQKAAFESERQRYDALAQGRPEAVQEILGKSPEALQAAAKMLLQQYQREQEQETMTPRERELRARLEQLEPMAERLQRQEQERIRAEQEAERAKALEGTKQELFGVAAQVLKAAGYTSQGAPYAMRTLVPILARYVEAGVPFDANEIAAQFKSERQALLADEVGKLSPEELIELYPELAERAAKGYLAKHRGQRLPAPQQQASQVVAQEKPSSDEDRWDAIKRLEATARRNI